MLIWSNICMVNCLIEVHLTLPHFDVIHRCSDHLYKMWVPFLRDGQYKKSTTLVKDVRSGLKLNPCIGVFTSHIPCPPSSLCARTICSLYVQYY